MNIFVNYSNTNPLSKVKIRCKRLSPGIDIQTAKHFYQRHGKDYLDVINIRNSGSSSKQQFKSTTPAMLNKHLHIYYSNDNNNLHAVNHMIVNHYATNKSKQIQINEHKLLQLQFKERINQLSKQIAFEPVVKRIQYQRSGSVGVKGSCNGSQLGVGVQQKGTRTHTEENNVNESYEKNKEWSCINNYNLLKKQRMHFVYRKINYKLKHNNINKDDNINNNDTTNINNNNMNGDTMYSTSRCKWNCQCNNNNNNSSWTNIHNNNNININSSKYDKPKINLDDILLNYNTNFKRSLSYRKIHPYQLKLSPFINHHIKYMPKS